MATVTVELAAVVANNYCEIDIDDLVLAVHMDHFYNTDDVDRRVNRLRSGGLQDYRADYSLRWHDGVGWDSRWPNWMLQYRHRMAV